MESSIAGEYDTGVGGFLSLILALSFSSTQTTHTVRHLLQTVPPMPSLPKVTLPPLPTLPPIPQATLPPIPSTALPTLPTVPTLPKPTMPPLPSTQIPSSLSIPTLPTMPAVPKYNLLCQKIHSPPSPQFPQPWSTNQRFSRVQILPNHISSNSHWSFQICSINTHHKYWSSAENNLPHRITPFQSSPAPCTFNSDQTMAAFRCCLALSMILALSISSVQTTRAARHLLQTVPTTMPKVTLPPLPAVPTIPKATLPPLLIPTLPALPTAPALPKPTTLPPLPSTQIPSSLPNPTMPTVPKVTLPPLPATSLPTIPTAIPSIPTIPTTMPTIPFFSPPPSN
ncbi:uncharacterized protein LOC130781537 [Actinidia eriantha]|uniref:uncharacterized protein LOC130781537 n=1 Tax=Actinidia eriantha TaxID=165200 RepID=UPI0025837F95|nr:uncharacterized protein LOC130781537 [Actinidia eriantha]